MRCTPEAISTALLDIDRRQLRRRREPATDGRINFCSNDYLGLARDPRIAAAMAEAASRLGAGSGASHLISGHSSEHEALEQELAVFTGRERALVFSTGYMANLGVLTALADRRDVLIADELNHASLIDAARLARSARYQWYAHGDAQAAETLLASSPSSDTEDRGVFVITDGVFSMDGDLAPLPALAALAKKQDGWLIVDDAHGLGVVGETGRGSCEVFGVGSKEVPVLIGTFGKAFGTFGAFVAGDAEVIEVLIQRARTYIYTTALPPAVAAATRAALEIVQQESWRRDHLRALIARFREGARCRGLRVTDSTTPIQPMILGRAEDALSASAKLSAAGFRVTAIRPPTVPEGTARLRITLSAAHTESQVDGLLSALEAAGS